MLIVPLMLPVVSERKTMSDFGGIVGVCTVFVTSDDDPGKIVFVTVEGLSPGGGGVSAETRGADPPKPATAIKAMKSENKPRRIQVLDFIVPSVANPFEGGSCLLFRL